MPENLPAVVDPAAVEVVDAELVAGPADPVAVYLNDLDSAESRRTMRSTLDRLAALLCEVTGEPVRKAADVPWHRITAEQASEIRALVIDRYSVSTAKRMMSGLSRVLRQCWRLELLEYETYRRVTAWEPIKGKALEGAAAGRHVDAGELRAMFVSCAQDPHPARGARDAALLAVLYGAGLRRAEAVRLDLDDFNPETGALRVHGKGNKTRLAYCENGSCEALVAWLRFRGDEPGPLFVAVNKGGRVGPTVGRLTTNAIYLILRRRSIEADVREFVPHDLRRSYIGELLDAGVDLATVQQMVGHASAGQTAKYDRRGEDAKRRGARMLHVPYVSPAALPADAGTDDA